MHKKKLISLILLVLVFNSVSFVSAQTTEADKVEKTNAAVLKTEKKDDNKKTLAKATPLKSFFARFVRSKDDKKSKTVDVVQQDQPAVQKGVIVYTIDDCVNLALKNSPNVKNKQKTYEAQKSEVGIAKSNYFPTFYGGTGYNYQYIKNNGDISSSKNTNSYGFDAGISALIWDFGRTTANINMNKFNRDAAFYELDYSKVGCVFDTKVAYTAVLAARAATDVHALNVKINKLNVERTKAMYEVGMKSKIDVVNAESNFTEAEINLLEAQNKYQNSLIELNYYMYYRNPPTYSLVPTETFRINKEYKIKNEINVAYDSKNYSKNDYNATIKEGSIFTGTVEKRNVADSYVLTPFPLTMQETIDSAFKNRADLKAMNLVKKASEESLKAIKRSYYPALNASGAYQYNKYQDYNSNSVGFYGGLDLPNVNVMAIKNQIEQGKAYLEIAKNNVDLLETDIYFEIQSLYVNMKQIEEKIPLMKQKVQYALENFELADGRYAVGMGNYLELQQSLTDFSNAQLNFVNTVFLYNKARFSLEKAMNVIQNY